MKKVFVIGSVKHMDKILEAAKSYMKEGYAVRHVIPQPDQLKESLIDEAFRIIFNSDMIVAVTKPEGGFGDGTLYEISFAKFLGKEIVLY